VCRTKVRTSLEAFETRVLRVADVIRGSVVGLCVCVFSGYFGLRRKILPSV
jgi:hypothetical protein